MTTQMRVQERPEQGSGWSVVVGDDEHRINGYAELCQLKLQYPDAECRLHGTEETALRKADIERAMAQFKATGGRGWTSG